MYNIKNTLHPAQKKRIKKNAKKKTRKKKYGKKNIYYKSYNIKISLKKYKLFIYGNMAYVGCSA